MRTSALSRAACAGSLLFALVSAASSPPTGRSVEDPIGDALSHGDTNKELDLQRLTVERKPGGRLEVTFETAEALPRTPKTKVLFIVYLDTDRNAQTGRMYGDIGVDLNLVVYREPADTQWRALADASSPVTKGETFTVSKLNVTRNSASMTVVSPVFKRFESFLLYAEAVSGEDTVDRVPDRGFLEW